MKKNIFLFTFLFTICLLSQAEPKFIFPERFKQYNVNLFSINSFPGRAVADYSIVQNTAGKGLALQTNAKFRWEIILLTSVAILIILLLSVGFTMFYGTKVKKQEAELHNARHLLIVLQDIYESKDNKLKLLLEEKLYVIKRLTRISKLSPERISSFLKEYNNLFGHDLYGILNWNNIYLVINQLHDNIEDKLRIRYMELSEKEIQLCCLIRADFMPDEIAFLLEYEYNSVAPTKQRLRKKMGFENHNDFIDFLAKL